MLEADTLCLKMHDGFVEVRNLEFDGVIDVPLFLGHERPRSRMPSRASGPDPSAGRSL